MKTTHPIAHPRVYFWYLKRSFLRKYLLCNQDDSGGRLVRDQEVGGSNPLAPTNSFLKISYLEIPRFVPKSAGNGVALFLPFSCNGPLGSHGASPSSAWNLFHRRGAPDHCSTLTSVARQHG